MLPVVSMHPVEERALSSTNAILLNNSAGLQYPGVGVKALLGVGKEGLGDGPEWLSHSPGSWDLESGRPLSRPSRTR